MFWRFIGLFALALLWHLPAQLDAFIAPSMGCHHNGSWYADKSLVPTMEKCLNCQCNKKSLVCRLKVCPEMPMPPPRGCIVVQKKNTCCPYLSCARLDAFYKIPATRRIIAYLDHYERESIDRVVNENMLQRRSDDSEVDLYVCVKNGTVYKSGSAMSSSNLCTYCYCIGGAEKCVKPKCMLPVEGCKPIFVDSTCCPVRYDCTAKPSGKSSQEVRYRKTSNKHFLRMSQRLQRNRGCTVGTQFYVEGQKMKSDPDKPCDICFCIRGRRRCAPKKCSPALKNCLPVVPKGQCCPSSYDCDSQRDYHRAQNSRQFNLFSLLFGKDEEKNGTNIPVEYPPDRHPSVTVAHKENILEKNDEKSIFDTIREGLEIIDGNNEEVLVQNIDKLATQTAQLASEAEEVVGTSTAPSVKDTSTTEVNFLDLLLGSPEDQIVDEVVEQIAPEVKTTTADGLSWVDLLLGPDEEESISKDTTNSAKPEPAATTAHYQYEPPVTSIDRIGDEVPDDYTASGEVIVGDSYEGELPSSMQEDITTEVGSTTEPADQTTEERFIDDLAPFGVGKSTNQPETTEKVTTIIKHIQPVSVPTSTAKPNRTKVNATIADKQTTTTKRAISHTTSAPTTTTTSTTPTTTTASTTTTTTRKPIDKLHKIDANYTKLLHETKMPTKNATKITAHKPTAKPNDLLTALLDGITEMLNVEKKPNETFAKPPANKTRTANNPTQTTTTTTKLPLKPHNLPTPKPLPLFKPLPTHKPHTRINSKIANLTVTPGNSTLPHSNTFKPQPAQLTQQPLSAPPPPPPPSPTTTTTTTTTTTKKPPSGTTTTTTTTTTAKPLLIKTNPTILETELFDSNAEPTLPPSLPNLKIIPFLPTDAVKADKPLYDYYHSQKPTAKIDYDLYDEANLYPSITERYPIYPDLEDDSKAEYIYKFNVEGPATAAVSSTAGKLDGATGGAAAFVKYDFAGGSVPNKGFSPPTKTEGGFVPKAPLIIDDELDEGVGVKLEDVGYQQVTKHIIDITTGAPMLENTTKLIEITTPDPFKDVIRTEPPPDLAVLIEDKEKILESKQQFEAATIQRKEANKPKVNDFIHITTSAPVELEINQNNMTTTINKTKVQNKVVQQKSGIEQFFDMLLRDEQENDDMEAIAAVMPTQSPTLLSSAIPPFKTLPETAIKQLPAITTIAKTATATTDNSTKTIPTTATTLSAETNHNATATRIKTKTKHHTHRNTTVAAEKTTATNKSATATHRLRTTKPKANATRRTPTKSTNTTNATNTHRRRISTTTNLPSSSSTTTTSTTVTTTTNTAPSSSTTTHPYMMSPFDKLPFMDASFEVKRSTLPPVATKTQADDFVLQFKNSLNKFEGLEPAYESFLSTSTSTSAPLAQRNVGQIADEAAGVDREQTPTNNLIDSAGVLKLAGCNIYGRMYRVGRIILELSSPCLECKCTEVGVKCGQLDC